MVGASLTVRRTPSSTLFPYTTLFRSTWRRYFAFARRYARQRSGDMEKRHFSRAEWYFKFPAPGGTAIVSRSEEHTSELQSLAYLVCRLLLEKKNNGSACSTNHYSIRA